MNVAIKPAISKISLDKRLQAPITVIVGGDREYLADGACAGRHTLRTGVRLKPLVWLLLVALGSQTLPEQSLASTFSPGKCSNTPSGTGPDGQAIGAGQEPVDGSGTWSNVVGCNATGGNYVGVQVMGARASATGDGAVAVGYAAVGGLRGTALGMQAVASGSGATALGQWTRATGTGSVAIGGNTSTNTAAAGAQASGDNAIAIGAQSAAKQLGDVALGWGTSAQSGVTGSSALAATAIGTYASATGLVSTAIGYKANANGTAASALGGQAQATANYATAVGTTTVGNSGATGVWSSALGTNANATADGATAVGARAAASGVSSIAIGSNNNPASTTDPSVTSAATDSIAIGNRTSASSGATEGVVIGASSSVSAANAAAIGYRATASGAGSLALGGNATGGAVAAATDSLAFGGQSAVASGATSGIAVGRGSSVAAAATYGIAMGDAAAARQANDIAIGRNAATNANSPGNNIAVGNGVTTGANGQNVAMGSGTTTANSRTGNGGAVAIGRSQKATGDGAVALGDPNTANGDGATAIGANNTAAGSTDGSTAANGAVAIGNSNQAIGQGSVALGNSSKAEAAGGLAMGDTADAQANNGVAMGSGSTAANANDVALGSNSKTAAAVGTANTTINGTTYSFAGTNPGSTVSVGASGAERTITNVAAGRLSGSSTDAVNGSQLYAANQAVGTLGTNLNNLGNSAASAIGGGVSYDSSTGNLSQPSYNIAGGTQSNISDAINALNQGWTLTTSGNTSGASNAAVQPGSTVTIRGGSNIELTQNGTDITAATSATPSFDSVTINNGGPTLSSSGIDMGSTKLSNLANGTDANDAVNVSQLTDLANGGTKYFHANSTLADSNPAGTDSVAIGPEAVAQNDGDLAVGQGASTANGQAGDVALGAGSKTAAVVGTSNTTINGESYNFAGTAPNSTVSVGDAGAERTITNVAAGRLSDSSTDAVNGSQLYAANSAIDTLGTQVNTNTSNLQNLGNSAASALGGNASYDATTGTLTTSNVGGTGQDTVDGAISSINATANKGWNVTTSATGSGVANGTSVANVKPGDTATITAGDNLITTQNGTEVAIGLNPTLTGLTSLALASGPALSSSGIDMGSTKISNLANGTDPNDAVNVSQLDAATGNLTSAGLNFTDASGKSQETAHVDLGGTLPIIGATTQVATGLDTSGTATAGSYSAQNVQTYVDATTGKVQVQMADNPNFTSVTTGNTVMNNDGVTVSGGANGPVSLTSAGLDNGGNTITHVGAGSVAAGSTDAVNGDQLNTTNQSVATNTTNLQNLGNSAVGVLGGNASYDASTGTLTTSNVGGTGQDTVDGAISSINTTANKGWNVTTSATGSGVANGTSVANVKPGDTATITAGDNLITTQNGTEVAIGLNPTLTGLTSLALASGPALSSSGIDMGNTKVNNLANGTDANDAVNVSQLDAATNNLTSAGLNFTDASGKSEETAHVDLGGTLPIIGATTQTATGLDTSGTATAGSYSAQNLQTYVDASTGKVQVQMADNPNFTSVTTGNTVMDNSGVTVSGGSNGPVHLTNAGLDNGGNTITNVAPGTLTENSTDAVNGSQLYEVQQAANAGWQASADNGIAQQITPNGSVKFTTGGDTNLTMSQTNATADANQATIQVQLAKNLDLGSDGNVTTGNTVMDNSGVTVNGGSNGPVHLTNAGLDNGGNTITNVAPGALDENSTDAVNGSQLHTTNQNVATNTTNLQNLGNSAASALGGNASYDATTGTLTTSNVGGTGQDTVDGAISSINATANKGWNVTTSATGSGVANGTSVANVKPGDTATITAGDNLITTQNGTEVAIGLNPTLTGLTSLALASGPALSSSGIDMGSTKISNLANGTDANDAVNVSQLDAATGSLTSAGLNFTDASGKSQETAHVDLGGTLPIIGATTQVATSLDTSGTATAGSYSAQNVQTYVDATTGKVQVQLADNPNFTSVTTGNTVMNNDGVTVSGGANGPVTLTNAGLDNGGNTITHVAAGNVAAGSTDAVNGDQLNTTNQNVATNTTNLQNLGNSAASVLGGNASYDATTGTLTTSNVGGTGQDTVDGAISSINATANKGWNVTTSATGSGVANGTSVANVKPGDTATITAGDNLITTQNGTEVAIGLNPTLTGLTSLALASGPALSSSGIDMGSTKISNLANGTDANDAVNVSQLQAVESTANNAVQYDNADKTSVTLGGTTSTDGGVTDGTTITNLHQGAVTSNSTDAVNGSQLYAVQQAANAGWQASADNGIAQQITPNGAVKFSTGGDTNLTVSQTNATANTNQATIQVQLAKSLDLGSTGSITTGNTVVNNSGVTVSGGANGPVTLTNTGLDNGGNTITHVGAGSVAAGSTDAVNGDQLNTTNQNVAANTTNLQNLGNSAASALGGNASYDAATGTLTTSNVGGTGQDTVDGAISSINATANKGWNVTTSATGSGVANGTSVANVKPGDTATITAGDNLITTQNGTEVAIGLNPTLTGLTSLALASGPALSSSGIDMGNTKISHLANGTDANDAVNVSQLQAVESTANNAVQYDNADRTSVTLGGTTSTDGGVTDGTTITNLHQGTVTSTSTDAVNGSQLYATNQQVSTNTANIATNTTNLQNLGNSAASALGGNASYDATTGTLTTSNVGGTGQDTVDGAISSINATANKGWNVTTSATGSGVANGTSVANVKPGDTATITAGDNLITTQNGTEVAIGLNPVLSGLTSITTGNSTLDSSGLSVNDGTNSTTYGATGMSIANGPSVTVAGIDAGNQKITHVAAGDVSASSTDAVNGSQLYATNQSISDITNGKAGAFQSDNSETSTQPVASGKNATAGGFGASATGAASTVIGNNATDNGVANSTVLGQGANIASGTTGSNVALGQGSTVASAAVPTTSGTINGTTYTYAGGTPAGVVSVGSEGNERQVTNVAAGQVTASSTDAVNGSQLYATNQAIAAVGTTATNLGNSTAAGLGGHSSYDASTGQLTTSLDVGGTTYTNVNDALNAVSSTASAGWNMTTSATGSGVANGSSVAKVAPGATATITAGNNIITTQNGTDVAIGVNPVLTGLTSVTTGNSTMDNRGVTVNDGTHSATYGATGMSIANGPSVSTAGVDAGGKPITNVAAGTAATDAANVGQVQAVKAGSVQYDTNADGSINYDSITLNPNGSPTAVHNVAPGTAPTDAANVEQVQQGMQAVQNWSKSYTDHAVNIMGNKAFAGVASAIATANVPQAYQPNQSSAGVGLGNFHGQSAISVGVSNISESGRWILKMNASSNTRGDAGFGVGAGIVW